MGLTLNLADFKNIRSHYKLVILGIVLQFTIMPILAIAIGLFLQLPEHAFIGMVLVGACPGGTASNVICYLAKANVPLSIVLTFLSTALAPLLTPAIVYVLLHQSIDISFINMMKSITLIVAAPLMCGIVIKYFFGKRIHHYTTIFPAISMLSITLIIACIVALNRYSIMTIPALIILAVILHNLGGLGLGYFLAKLFNAKEQEARTLAIEIGMQNSGLAIMLATKFFSATAAIAGAIFSIWHNISGTILAKVWQSSLYANKKLQYKID